jgi:hypothetical protein
MYLRTFDWTEIVRHAGTPAASANAYLFCVEFLLAGDAPCT